MCLQLECVRLFMPVISDEIVPLQQLKVCSSSLCCVMKHSTTELIRTFRRYALLRVRVSQFTMNCAYKLTEIIISKMYLAFNEQYDYIHKMDTNHNSLDVEPHFKLKSAQKG